MSLQRLLLGLEKIRAVLRRGNPLLNFFSRITIIPKGPKSIASCRKKAVRSMAGGCPSFRCRNEDPGSFTLRSTGLKILRSHVIDWVTVLVLVALSVGMNAIEPFHRFVGEDALAGLKFPFKPENTVPFRAVQAYSIFLPFIIFMLVYLRRKNAFDLHNATLGLLFAVLVTAVTTDSIKNAIGRPRPNFFWRCFPNGEAVFNESGDVACNGRHRVINEGYRSFPSGHTSWSFASMGYLSLYLAGKLNAFDKKGRISKLCVVYVPLLGATFVGVSRIDDYWHHWTDVVAGAVIGLVTAFFCYQQFFPSPLHVHGSYPHEYFQALEERNASQGHPATGNVEPLSGQQLNRLEAGRGDSDRSILSLVEHFNRNVHK